MLQIKNFMLTRLLVNRLLVNIAYIKICKYILRRAGATPYPSSRHAGVLSSTGMLIRSDIYLSYFLPYRSADVFLFFFFYPPSLSFCHSARLFTKRSLGKKRLTRSLLLIGYEFVLILSPNYLVFEKLHTLPLI